MTIHQEIQNPHPESPIVDFYELDATGIGGGVYRLTPGTPGDAFIYFNGLGYAPTRIEVDGMEVKGQGALPRPVVSISNVGRILAAEIQAYNDLIGAIFARIRTYAKYLDGEPGADPTAQFPKDIFIVERKKSINELQAQFELRAATDLEGTKIPKRQALPYCSRIYRSWDGSDWDYSNATCPYTDTDYYASDGTSTVTPADDVCGHKMFDCQLRFPSTNNPDDQLPMWGFPGVGQFGRVYRR